MTARSRRPRADAVQERPFVETAGVLALALKLAAVTLVLDPAAASPFALPKAAISRALTYVLLALVAVHLTRGRARLPLAHLAPLGVYVAIAVAATVTAPEPMTALFGADGRSLGLTSILDGAVLLLATATFVRRTSDLRVLGVALAATTAGVVAYALIQWAAIDPVRWATPDIVSTFGNRGPLGGFLLTSVSVFAFVLLTWWERLSFVQRGILSAVVSTGSVTMVMLGARAPLVAIPAVVAAVLILTPRIRSLGARGWIAYVSVGAALLLVLSVLILFATPVGPRLRALVTDAPPEDITSRLLIYDAALRAVGARPLLGAGPDGFVAIYTEVRSEAAATSPLVRPLESSTHSWVLHQAVGLGLTGASAALVMVVVALITALRRAADPDGARAALGTVALVAFLGQGLFNISSNSTDWIFWMSIGLCIPPVTLLSSGVTMDHGGRRRSRPAVSPIGRTTAGIALGVSMLAGLTVTPNLASSHETKDAMDLLARRPPDAGAAVATARRAIELDGRRAENWNLLGLAYSAHGDASAATSAFLKAAELAPRRSLYRLNAAKEQLRLGATPGSTERAVEHATAALRLDRYSVEALQVTAIALINAGRASEAARLIDRSLELRRDQAGYVLAAGAHEAAGDLDAAISRMRIALTLPEPPGEREPWRTRLQLAHLLVRAGKLFEARSVVESILADRPGEPEALALLTEIDRAR